jgi:tetratricopeptide (TPR) repeat protein
MVFGYSSLLLILGLLWLVTAFQLGLSARAWWIERREGMRLSRFRLSIVSVFFVISTGLMVAAFFLPETSQSSKRTSEAVEEKAPSNNSQNESTKKPDDSRNANLNPQLQEAEQEVATLEKKLTEAKQKLKDLQNRLNSPANTAVPQNSNASSGTGNSQGELPHGESLSISRESIVLNFIIAATILLLAGFVVLLTAGQIQTLFPSGWSMIPVKAKNESELEKKLQLLTRAVWQKNYKEGLKIADQIREKSLNPLDRLDYLFLRSYCSLTLATGEDEEFKETSRQMCDQSIKDLESLIDDAPNRGEALYLLGLAYGLSGKYSEAQEMFKRARENLRMDKELPFAHNESVCFLKLAEISLSKGDTQRAEGYFQRVTNLGKLAGSVVESRIKIGMIDLQNAINKKDMETARTAIIRLEELKGLTDAQRLQIEIIRTAFSARIKLRQGNAGEASIEIEKFLQKYLPPQLPKPDEEAADETLGSPIDASELPFPHEVFRGFFFIYAVALCMSETRNRSMLSESQVEKLSEPLLRGLQFSPRHRDLLGSLGGLIYWFRKKDRQKALEWLEAAATMGISGQIVKRILEQDRLIEVERRDALDWFRSASSRLLRDPSLNAEVRTTLIEELGRFQEFEALIVNLEEKPDFELEEPTLKVFKERAKYLLNLIAEFSKKGRTERKARLQAISNDYSAYIQTLENTTEGMTLLERRVFEELGDILEI